MEQYRRDALLAAGVLATLLGVLVAESAVETLARPLPAVGGVVGALLVEGAFLRYSTVATLWERPAVWAGSAVAVVTAGISSYVLVGPAVLATLCWGLATYFLLLAALVVFGRNPLAAVA